MHGSIPVFTFLTWLWSAGFTPGCFSLSRSEYDECQVLACFWASVSNTIWRKVAGPLCKLARSQGTRTMNVDSKDDCLQHVIYFYIFVRINLIFNVHVDILIMINSLFKGDLYLMLLHFVLIFLSLTS